MASPQDCPVRASGDGATPGGSNTSWAVARGLTSGDTPQSTQLGNWAGYVSNNAGDAFTYYLYRDHLPVDISGLPADITATQVDLVVKVNTTNHYSGAGGSLCLVESQAASPTALVASDFSKVGTTEFASRIAFSTVTDDQVLTFTLNTAGKAFVQAALDAGATSVQFCLRASQDLDNSAPGNTLYSGVFIYSADHGTAGNRPKLVVTYLARARRSFAQPYAVQTNVPVGRSWAQPAGMTGAVGRSWAQPSEVVTAWRASFGASARGGSDASWAAARAATVADVAQAHVGAAGGYWLAYVSRNAGDPHLFQAYRSIFVFDITASGLPVPGVDQEYGSFAIKVRVPAPASDLFTGAGGSLVAVGGGALASDSAVTPADFPGFAGTREYGRWTLGGATLPDTGGAYVATLTLNRTAIADLSDAVRRGDTKFRIGFRLSQDVDNSAPGNTLYSGIIGNGAGGANKPELAVGALQAIAHRSWAQPFSVTLPVGRSWAQPSYVDSPRVMNRWAQPSTIYNFAAGLRGWQNATQTVRAANAAGNHDSHDSFPSMIRVEDPVHAPFGKLVMIFRQGTTHGDYAGPEPAVGYNGWFTRKQTINLGGAWTNDAGVAGTGASSEDQGVIQAVPPATDLRSNFTHYDVDGSILIGWYQRKWGGGRSGEGADKTPITPYDGALDYFRSYIARSTDGLKTATVVCEITGEDLGFDTAGVYSQFNLGSFLVLPTGRWMVFGEGRKSVNYTGSTDTWMHGKWGYSDDQGTTWHAGGDIATVAQTAPGGVPTSNYEHEAILLDNGRIFVAIRVQDHITGGRAHYYATYMDPPYTSFVTPFKIIDSVTNRPALLQTVTGDVLLISGGQGSGGNYWTGITVWQSKDRGGTFASAATTGTSGYNGAWLREATPHDSDGNVLLAWAEEFNSQLQASVFFRKLSSAASSPPPPDIAPTGASWAQPSTVIQAVGRSWAQPANVTGSVGRSYPQPAVMRAYVGRSYGQTWLVAGGVTRSWPQPSTVIATLGRSWAQPALVAGGVNRSWPQAYSMAGQAHRSWPQPYVLDHAPNLRQRFMATA